MRCEEVIPELPAFLDGELSPAERDALSVHLVGCASCEAERAWISRTMARVRDLPRAAAPASLAGAVMGALAVRPAPARPEGVEMPGTCGSVEAAELSAFLDGELPEAARDRTREHIAVCALCAETLVWLDDVSGRVRVLPRVAAPANLLAIVLARIEDLLHSRRAPAVTAPAVSPVATPSPATRPWSRVARPGSTVRRGEPLQIPQGVKRFLAAASVLVLALGSLSLATPNVSGAIVDEGAPAPAFQHIPFKIDTGATEPVATKLPAANPERLMAVACDQPDRAVTALYALAASHIQVFATRDAHTLGLTGSVQDLRPALKRLPENCALEDATRIDVLLPAPQDQVETRNREVFQGVIERQDAQSVVLATSVRGAMNVGDPPPGRGTGLAGSYWEIPPEAGELGDTRSTFVAIEGRAAIVRTDGVVDFTTPGGGPAALAWNVPFVQLERIAVRWHGFLNADRAGRYTFVVGADDGALLEIDGILVANADGRHPYQESSGQLDLTRGLHSIDLRYFNGGGPGTCRLLYTPPGARQSAVVPESILYDPDRIEAGHRALTLTIPRRSVVRVTPASHEPVTVYVLLRRRSE